MFNLRYQPPFENASPSPVLSSLPEIKMEKDDAIDVYVIICAEDIFGVLGIKITSDSFLVLN